MSGETDETPGWSGERWLTVVGIVIAAIIVLGLGTLVLAGISPSDGSDAPNVEWDLVRLEGPYVRVVHAGGEPVNTDNLIVVVDGVKRPVEWEENVLDDGESGRVQAADGERLQLYWQEDGGGRVLLSNWVV